MRRERARRSRSHSRPRGSRRLSDDHYRRREGRGGRRRRYSGEMDRAEPSSWEDEGEEGEEGEEEATVVCQPVWMPMHRMYIEL